MSSGLLLEDKLGRIVLEDSSGTVQLEGSAGTAPAFSDVAEGTAGGAVDSSNSNFDSFVSAPDLTYNATDPAQGSQVIRVDSTTTASRWVGRTTFHPVTGKRGFRNYVRSNDVTTLVFWYLGTSNLPRVAFNSTGHIQLVESSTVLWTSTKVFAVDEWVRVEVLLDSTGTPSVTVRIWWGTDLHNDSTSATNYETSGAQSWTSGSAYSRWDLGELSNVIARVDVDAIAYDTDWVGAATTNPRTYFTSADTATATEAAQPIGISSSDTASATDAAGAKSSTAADTATATDTGSLDNVRAVSATADDGYGDTAAGSYSTSSFYAGSETDRLLYGFARVTNVPLAQGATVGEAFLTMNVLSANGGTSLRIKAIAEDNAATVSALADLTGGRSKTTASVDWAPAFGMAAVDVTSIVQEMVNRAGWVSGNAILFVLEPLTSGIIREAQIGDYAASAALATRLSVLLGAGGLTSKNSSDSATATDAASLAAAATSSDTASGVEAASLVTSLTSADTAAETEAVTARGLTAADTATATETDTARGSTAADTAAATDAASLAAAATSSDTGAGSEAATLAASATSSDVASGTEQTGSRAFGAADTASATDAATLAATQTSSDSASASSAQSLAASLTGTENGTATEAATQAAAQTSADTATGTEAVSLSAALTSPDTASSSEATGARALGAADTASAVEAATVAAAATSADTASGTEAATLAAAVGSADTATGSEGSGSVDQPKSSADTAAATEAVVARSITDSDSATATDAVAARAVTANDAGTASEAVTASVRATTAADAASASEAGSVAVSGAASDTAAATDAGNLAAAVTSAQTATAAEAITARAVTGSDSATATEQATVDTSQAVSSSDTATVTEAAFVTVVTTAADTATATDQVTLAAAVLSDEDEAIATELAQLAAAIAAQDAASAVEAASLSTQERNVTVYSGAGVHPRYARGVPRAGVVVGMTDTRSGTAAPQDRSAGGVQERHAEAVP